MSKTLKPHPSLPSAYIVLNNYGYQLGIVQHQGGVWLVLHHREVLPSYQSRVEAVTALTKLCNRRPKKSA